MDKSIRDKYTVVIGLEVHAQMLTKSKAYSSDSTEFGTLPNTNVSVITMGMPGTLPKINKKVVDYAIKMGIATNCDIREENIYARKNYFYPDLPKGYQITQDKTPVCRNGYVLIKDAEGNEKKVDLTRIHMEEDSGKSIHDQDPFDTLVDLNRAGVPLLEIVTEPVFVGLGYKLNVLTLNSFILKASAISLAYLGNIWYVPLKSPPKPVTLEIDVGIFAPIKSSSLKAVLASVTSVPSVKS